MSESVRVVRSHYATAKAWDWLLHGDGMRKTPEEHERIKTILLDLDELLNELDDATSNQEGSPHDGRS